MKALFIKSRFLVHASALAMVMLLGSTARAQDSLTAAVTDTTVAAADDTPVAAPVRKPKPVKIFNSSMVIDNETVEVGIKKTFEMNIMHRFGTIENGYEDFYGFFAPSNIRLAFSYVPIKDLMVGVSITKADMAWDGEAKYSLIKQTKNIWPVSVTYFGNVSVDTRTSDNFIHSTDRLSYFNQLLIARKVNDWLSLQVAPSISHINITEGYFKYEKTGSTGPDSIKSVLAPLMKHDHFAIAFSGRIKVKESMSLLVNVDQPITKHVSGNPRPNISFGIEVATSAHAFQFFLGNYPYITPQKNNMFNKNDYNDGQFLIGFNISRLWNY